MEVSHADDGQERRAVSFPGWNLSFWWILANVVGFVLIESAYWFSTRFLQWGSLGLWLIVTFLVFMFSVGTVQSLAIHHWLPSMRRWIWILATSIALLIAGLLVALLLAWLVLPYFALMAPDDFAPLAGAIFGGFVGVSQWLVLWRYSQHELAWLWIPVNIAAWAAGGALVQTDKLDALMGPDAKLLTEYIKAGLVGIVVGSLTGLVLVSLSRRLHLEAR